MLAKYYPNTGWYVWGDDPESRLNDWFEKHRHDSQCGNGFLLEFEIHPDAHIDPPIVYAEHVLRDSSPKEWTVNARISADPKE